MKDFIAKLAYLVHIVYDFAHVALIEPTHLQKQLPRYEDPTTNHNPWQQGFGDYGTAVDGFFRDIDDDGVEIDDYSLPGAEAEHKRWIISSAQVRRPAWEKFQKLGKSLLKRGSDFVKPTVNEFITLTCVPWPFATAVLYGPAPENVKDVDVADGIWFYNMKRNLITRKLPKKTWQTMRRFVIECLYKRCVLNFTMEERMRFDEIRESAPDKTILSDLNWWINHRFEPRSKVTLRPTSSVDVESNAWINPNSLYARAQEVAYNA